MTEPVVETTSTSYLSRFTGYLKSALNLEFDILLASYRKKDWLGSPGAKPIGWTEDGDPTKTAADFGQDRDRLLATAKALVAEAEKVKGNGVLHVRETDAHEHAYLFHTGWSPIPVKAFPFVSKLNSFNNFRVLPNCFATFIGELPEEVTPPTVTWEPEGIGESTMVVDRTEQHKSVVEHGKSQWSKNLIPHGYFQLGWSSIIRSRFYTEIHDDDSGLIVRNARFGTTSMHVFDGFLNWMSIVDTKNKRTMFACVGGGRHPVPGIDQINPIGGAIALSVMWRTYLRVLAGEDISATTFGCVPSNAIGSGEVNTYVKPLDSTLLRHRRLLQLADQPAIGIALVRQLLGPKTKDEGTEKD
jgi:hypothetical protein